MKNVYSRYCLFLLLVIGILFTSACTQDERNIGVLSEHPETGQAYEILNVSLLYEDFMQQAENINAEEINELYQAEIIEPVFEACFEDTEFLRGDYDTSLLTDAPSDLAKIQEVIDQMDFEHISSLIEETLVKSSDLLPSENETTVCVFPAVGGDSEAGMFVPGTGKIIALFSDYYYQDDRIQASIAHEYHHTLLYERTSNIENLASYTVLDELIMEGKAVMFEKILYPDSTNTHINRTYHKGFWNEIEPDLHKVDPERAYEIKMGGRGGVPSFYGYSEGYKMVEAYLELHPELTPAEWYDVDASVIYEEGNYISNYE